jgi:hypothetical protein
MAVPVLNRNLGMVVLAIWLILYGLAGFVAISIPPAAMGGLALVAGVLILIGR